jgi:hypothetical protein
MNTRLERGENVASNNLPKNNILAKERNKVEK